VRGREATAAYLTIVEGQSERQKAHKLKGAHSPPLPAGGTAEAAPSYFTSDRVLICRRSGFHQSGISGREPG